MGYIRPLEEEDLPEIVRLYTMVFGIRTGSSPAALNSYFQEIFCRHPWCDMDIPSLVYHEKNGRIVGCLGVMPRRMSVNGRPLQAAITHHFMVEPGSRWTLAGVELLRKFFAGPQDLSLAEGGNVARKMMERFGGATSFLHSLRWTRPLRPSRYLLSFLKRRGLAAPFERALMPLCWAADAIAPLILRTPFSLSSPRLAGEELNEESLLWCVSEFSRSRSLRPEYDKDSVKWLLELLARKKSRGTVQKVVLRDSWGEIVGWYLYYLHRGDVSEVIQIGATQGAMSDLLDHLFFHAWQQGAIAVSGQLDAGALQAFSEKTCVFHHDSCSWILIHSKHPDVFEAMHRGDAFFTRLEGEWCIAF